MKKTKSLIFSLAVALIASQITWAEDSHNHHSAGDGEQQKLELDHGKKWETDKPLREGMKRIRQLMEADLHAIHESKLNEVAYSALSQKITVELNQIFKDCKLKPQADAVLHLILAQVIAGTTQMKAEKQRAHRRDGAIQIIQALDQYAKFFNHPGWEAIRH